jgi:hypothetical protein
VYATPFPTFHEEVIFFGLAVWLQHCDWFAIVQANGHGGCRRLRWARWQELVRTKSRNGSVHRVRNSLGEASHRRASTRRHAISADFPMATACACGSFQCSLGEGMNMFEAVAASSPSTTQRVFFCECELSQPLGCRRLPVCKRNMVKCGREVSVRKSKRQSS